MDVSSLGRVCEQTKSRLLRTVQDKFIPSRWCDHLTDFGHGVDERAFVGQGMRADEEQPA